ncbi:MAG TPA: hypothetical protein VFE62_09235 [Gemmataceae bacterium]|nr:hypothetical protein [Gemmataceae bacterium]
MKARFLLGVCLSGVVAFLGTASTSHAQQGQYVTQAAARLSKLIDAGNNAGYSLQNNSFSLGGGWLKKSESWVAIYSVNLVKGTKYRFLASGDNDAKDVDLRVMDPEGNQVAIDDKVDLNAIVNYTAKTSGKHMVQIRLYDSNENLPAVCLSAMMIMKK